ncbi:ABC transporter permease [Mucilaginibacter gilvus]|uniref:ABC transporter permease n=1 Tax=Mucilaginibacter gilvus TaxID=2305909 RepID=A0A444MNP5_9SPHI|nr:ABC transporter permease [Mucilaginibacter gilvus]RWY52246.1 ABC transporter permease [Mucilaginibacter gilvus]
MKGFILSFRSEFYKSRKTLGFWSSILLPLLICFFIAVGFYLKSERLAALSGMALWMQFAGLALGVMGSLLLPMFAIFLAYSVNSIEHKADTWKTLFSLPMSRWAIYSAKYFYAVFLLFTCMGLFALFTVIFGNLLSLLKPELKFDTYHLEIEIGEIYFKLFLSALGILSIQFLLSLLWSDFLKPMGIGFVCFILGVISVSTNWEYSYAFPYAHPMIALKSMMKPGKGGPAKEFAIDIFTKDVFVSLGVAAVVFVLGYFIVRKKSVK